MPGPFERCSAVGSCSLDATWKLHSSQKLSPALRHVQPHQTVRRRGYMTGDGLHWALGLLGFLFLVDSKFDPD